ncbi:MAG: DUF3427 domain-containing protein [Ilumatobacter sp.]
MLVLGHLGGMASWEDVVVGDEDLKRGLYDRLVDQATAAAIDELGPGLISTADAPDAADLPDRVASAVARIVHAVLTSTPSDKLSEVSRGLVDAVVDRVAQLELGSLDDSRLANPVRRLKAIEERSPSGEAIVIERPKTPLRSTVLMTNGPTEPSIGHELRHEVDSADGIDLVLAFIRWTGIDQLLDPLRRHVDRGGRLRVITTTYTGSTEPRALDALAELGAEIKVSYDTRTTRLHAKAWHFQRATGFSTVFVGSSNLTHSAQVAGKEWNVRASMDANPELIDAFERTFETYWEDPHFEDYDPSRFVRAISRERADDSIVATPFELQPYPFQRHILERLRVERSKNRPHNLIVAATGTGKTVVSAFDFRYLRSTLDRSRLLFIAHRKEILEQSRTTFRHVLRDGAFGELWVDGERPTEWEHVFASIQSLANHVGEIDPNRFDVVIVDEFHHAAADSYSELLDRLKPTHLLGMTATPERADGLDVRRWFDGRIAVELRLWHALEQELLVPFRYFGVSDGTDLSRVRFAAGRYVASELTNVYTADDVWVSKVIAAVRRRVTDPMVMRAIGFCASVAHAEFMANSFNAHGFTTVALSAHTPSDERRAAANGLRDGSIHAVFAVDLFNEGVDIPSVDTVLMLRPTESATIFLQQLGRGLRRDESTGKTELTVLDFVGVQADGFRFDQRFRGLLGRTRRELERDIEDEFPFLPSGCSINLDPVARAVVLDNVRRALPQNVTQRVAELRELGDVGLADYLTETGLEIDDVFVGDHSWSSLRRMVGIENRAMGPDEERVRKGVGRLLHVDDAERLSSYARWAGGPTPDASVLPLTERRRLEGMAFGLLGTVRAAEFQSLQDAIDHLWKHPVVLAELGEAIDLLGDQVMHEQTPLAIGDAPLEIHASYSQSEVLAAFGDSTLATPRNLQAGVWWSEANQTDVFFVTLQKTERDYSPKTRYLDYAISEHLFHWESQSVTSTSSPTGQRYLNHRERGSKIVLFVRETRKDDVGRTSPYLCLGPASYVSHRSERPIKITWRLECPIPGDVFTRYRTAVA